MSTDEKYSEKLNKLIRKSFDKIIKDKKSLFIIIIGLSGMLLILFSGSHTVTDDIEEVIVSDDAFAYDAVLKQVKDLICAIDGVGKAEVVITYENDFETVYATNVNEKYNGDDIDIDREYIITDDETGLKIKSLYPQVRGVAVVCQGGGNPSVKEKIYSALSALFDISTNKISVVDMK